MKRLDDNYDICVDDMLPMLIEQEKGDFKIKNGEFYRTKDFEKVNMPILATGRIDCGALNKQIFSMKDGKFILEIEENYEVEYFYSENLDELIN